MRPLDEWNSKDKKPSCYIRWYHRLFLWAIPTQKTYNDGGIQYTKYFRNHIYLMGWKRIKKEK